MSTRTRAARVLTAALLVAVPLAVVPLTSLPATADEEPSLEQSVTAGEEIVGEETVVTDGHVDVGPRFVEGEWTMLARDDRTYPPVWRAPEDVVYQLGEASVLPAPDSPDYAFLGVEPGTPLYVVPQTQATGVPWLGWNTQHPGVVERLADGARLRLDAVDGPGDLVVFLQEGVSGPPNVLWQSGDALPQELFMETNTHVHANWVFTAPGTYVLDVAMVAELADGEAVEDTARLLFAVGEGTDPQDVLAAGAQAAAADTEVQPSGEPADETSDATTAAPPSGDAGDTGATASFGPALWAVPLALLLAAVAVVGMLRSRRARAEAERDEPGAGR
ncbi:choice-of-anchor M domain-containing protein [Antribacter gilvus]|uniref:choice-of-anchor M domain-containing protein n=1 Tax=Antribacter gilvus TaxID=2304675 RepID=UPI000F776F25|nr:choice-of-anchor M domain-containing protein [Antribacter gilvus]